MGIEQIPGDELLTMTELWHRSFNAAGCNPMCHCCEKMIAIGEQFKLSTINKIPTKEFDGDNSGYKIHAHIQVEDLNKEVETKEVMLCDTCTPELFLQKQKKELEGNLELAKELLLKRKQEGGCFRINGKIVH